MNDTTMPVARKNPRRNNRKVPRRGFGLNDWIRLVNSAKDLAQRKGQPLRKNISKEEVESHSSVHDGWIILRNKVYFISPYLPYHPGGDEILKPVLGKDATTLFDKYHRWVNIDGLMGALLIGSLDVRPQNDDDTTRSYGEPLEEERKLGLNVILEE